MNVGKLKRVAIKEFKRSPAKTGFLLAMLPVALYFCVPPLVGALKKSSTSPSAAKVAEVSREASSVVPAATNAAAPSRTEQGWVEVARSLVNDALAMPTGIPANARNPFAVSKQEKNGETQTAATDGKGVDGARPGAEPVGGVEKAVVASDPIRALGYRLTATMVGQRSRAATINGKTYKVGDTIPVPGMAANVVATVPVTLKSVDRQFVVLKMAGHEHQLQLPNEFAQDAIVVKSRSE